MVVAAASDIALEGISESEKQVNNRVFELNKKETGIKGYEIKKITPKKGSKLLDRWDKKKMTKDDYGLFYSVYPDGSFTAIDNSTGDCWTEDFKTLEECIAYLQGGPIPGSDKYDR